MGDPRLFSVLVTCGGGYQGLAVVEPLRLCQGVRILIADCYREHVGKQRADASFVVPKIETGPPYLDALAGICRDQGVELVVPATALDLEVLAGAREQIVETGAELAVSDLGLLQILLDKGAAHSWSIKHGLPTMPRVTLDCPAGNYPLLGKPRQGWGGRGQIILHSPDELPSHSLERLRRDYVWERKLDNFEEISLDFAINHQAEVSPVVARARRQATIGFAVICEAVDDPRVVLLGERIAAALGSQGGRGLFNAQLIRRGEGLLISDINPRVGTSSAFSLGRGVNLLEFLCRPIGGERVVWDRHLDGRLRGTRVVRQLTDSWYQTADLEELQGLVFDLDDTLIDQKRWIYEKFRLLADRFGGQLGAPGDFLATAMRIVEEGDRRTTIDAAIASLGLDPALRDPLVEAYRELEPEVCRTFPDVIPSLLTLRQMGLKMGILTDNPPDSQRQKLRRAGRLEELADAVVFTREAGGEKPDPAGYLEIARRLDLPPNVLAAVGDNPYRDAAGAVAAGYGYVFLITRAQGLFHIDEAIYRESTSGQRGEYSRVEDLRALVACVSLGRSPGRLPVKRL